MTNFTTILFEQQRRGVLITLNRPSVLNAMNRLLKGELQAALELARDDDEIRAVVITGAGSAFSVGDDLNESLTGPTAWPYGIPENSALGRVYDDLRDTARKEKIDRQLYRWQYPKPIIAAVSGWCLGSAAALALSAHLTIGADDAVFGQPQVRHSDGTDFIWTVLGKFKNASRYGLTGDHIDAKEALRLRLINKIVSKEQLLDEVFRLVERIALVPPDTVKINLQKATSGYEMMGLAKAWSLDAELSALAQLSRREEFYRPLEEARQRGGLSAFIDKRDAPFQPEPFGPHARKREG
jgi:enoyl-CoA hydratase/carnithine racemase